MINLSDFENKIFRVSIVSQKINMLIPYKNLKINESSGTAWVIDEYKLATCYHVIEDAVNINIFKSGDSDNPVEVLVNSIYPEIDFAILEIKDKNKNKFTEMIIPKNGYNNYNKQDKIYSIGYPLGNKDIQLTEGIISGFNINSNLVITTIPLNPGNSGGPIFNEDGILIGQANQKVSDVSVEGVSYFQKLKLITSRYYNTDNSLLAYENIIRPIKLGISFYPLYKNYIDLYKLNNIIKNISGIIIKDIYYFSILKNILKKNDIIVSINSLKINNTGNVITNKNSNELININNYIFNFSIGDSIEIEFISNNKLQKNSFKIELQKLSIDYVYYPIDKPKYEIIGGLVLQQINVNILEYLIDRTSITSNLTIFNNLISLYNIKYSNNELFIITFIIPGSIAYNNEILKRGDIILKINDININNFLDIYNSIDDKKNNIKIETIDSKINIFNKKDILKSDLQLSKSYNFNLTKIYNILKKN